MINTEASIEQQLRLPQAAKHGVKVFMKRDDLIHPYISGNKWRKLSGILSYAAKNNAGTLLTYGGPFSNHLLATACAGAMNGYRTKGIVRGEPVKNHVLMLCKLYGMELEFVSREKMSQLREAEHLSMEGNTLLIPEGGNCPEGEVGCEAILDECEEEYSHILVALGTGTTLRGLQRSHNPEALLHGIVAMKNQSFSSMENEFTRIHHGYHFGGYGKFSPELIELGKAFSSQTGILLDPVYTLKMYAAFLDLLEKDVFKPHEKVLLIHTGGLTGWLGPDTPQLI